MRRMKDKIEGSITNADYANSAGSVAWDKVSGKPSSYPPSNHTHAYLPLGGGTLTGALHIKQPNSGSYNENIRIYPSSNNWTSIVMCGDDNTGNSGTSAKTWGIFTCNGEISIAKNGTNLSGGTSNASLTCKSDNIWRVNNTPLLTTTGGTMSGQITKSTGGSWIGDRDRAAIKSNYAGDSSYGAVAAMATKNGYWTMGNLGGNESLIFNYSTDANYNAGNNSTSQVYLPAQAGTIITSATIGSQSVNYANNAGNATNAINATNATNAANATTATKLSSNAGSNNQPVYFSGGKPIAIGYTIAKSVPADAKFTDTNTWRGIQNNLTSDSTDQSLSAAQGKALKTLVDGKAPISHTHTKSQITDFPTSMPASDVSAWAKAPTKPTYTKAEVGLGNVDNTADKDKNVKYATSAGLATNAQCLNNDSQYMRFHWNGQSGQPTWLWGGNDASNMYVYNPSNFSVNYAATAGNGVYSSDINIWGNEGYIRFKDGIQICWGTSTSGSASGSFTFPQRFVYLPCIMISGTGAYRYAFYVTKSENTGFKYYRDGSGTTASPQYVAIGNWDNSSL